MFRPVLVLASVLSTWLTTAEIQVLECIWCGRVMLFASAVHLGLAVCLAWHGSRWSWEDVTSPSLEIFKIWID